MLKTLTMKGGTDLINEADGLCHLRLDDGADVPLCGSRKNVARCVASGKPVPPDGEVCPACGRKRCPTCRAIKDSYQRTGGYEGAE